MTAHTPLRCANSVMVQRGSNEVVLFNTGFYPSFSDYLNETWKWNGTDWTNTSANLINTGAPPGRTNAMMGYDGTNVMLYGGQGKSSTQGGFQDTWVWNGTTWTQVNTGIFSSAPTSYPLMRWSAQTSNHNANQVVMFGGQNTLVKLEDTWIWNGSTQLWSQVSTPNTAVGTPAGRTDHMMQGNTSGLTLLFGGQGNNQQFNDTWTFNGTTWTQLTPALSPSIRSDAAIAYDSVNSLWVMFGGRNEYYFLPETWVYQAGGINNWKQVSVGTGPAGRIGAQMTFDTQSGKTIMFGGSLASNYYPSNETWSFNGATLAWTQL